MPQKVTSAALLLPTRGRATPCRDGFRRWSSSTSPLGAAQLARPAGDVAAAWELSLGIYLIAKAFRSMRFSSREGDATQEPTAARST
jgi:hypothetical protein